MVFRLVVVALCCGACSLAFLGPLQQQQQQPSRAVMRRAKQQKKGEEKRGEEKSKYERFLESKFSADAAAAYRFEQDRDKGKYSKERARKMGAKEGEEYDLSTALDANTDDLITKIIAGAFIIALTAGLYAALLDPLLQPASFVDANTGITYVKDSRTGQFVQR